MKNTYFNFLKLHLNGHTWLVANMLDRAVSEVTEMPSGSTILYPGAQVCISNQSNISLTIIQGPA